MWGEYFSWLSHDDLYPPYKIQMQIDILRKEMQGRHHLRQLREYRRKFQGHLHFQRGGNVSQEKLGHSLFPLLRGLINGCSLLIHKSHFERVGLFDEKLRTTGDYDLWFRMFHGAKLIYHDGILVKYRCHLEQDTNCALSI